MVMAGDVQLGDIIAFAHGDGLIDGAAHFVTKSHLAGTKMVEFLK